MAALHFHLSSSPSPKLLHFQNFNHFTHLSSNLPFLKQASPKLRVFNSRSYTFCCFCKSNLCKEDQEESNEEEEVMKVDDDRPPFDLSLAVLLAGFAFEAYWSPPENVGTREVDSANCQTVFLSEVFMREVYDGLLFIKLKKGVNFPALDPWWFLSYIGKLGVIFDFCMQRLCIS